MFNTITACEVNGIKVGDVVRGNRGNGNLFGVVGFCQDSFGTVFADCRDAENLKNKFKFKFTLDVLKVASK